MYTKDKISNGGEMKEPEKIYLSEKSPFYLFIMPKSPQSTEVSTLLKVVLHDDNLKESHEMPFMLNTWNPVSVKMVTLSKEDLVKYRVFWGTEG